MVDPLMSRDINTSLVNSDNKGRVLSSSFTLGVGVSFSRKNSTPLMRMGD